MSLLFPFNINGRGETKAIFSSNTHLHTHTLLPTAHHTHSLANTVANQTSNRFIRYRTTRQCFVLIIDEPSPSSRSLSTINIHRYIQLRSFFQHRRFANRFSTDNLSVTTPHNVYMIQLNPILYSKNQASGYTHTHVPSAIAHPTVSQP